VSVIFHQWFILLPLTSDLVKEHLDKSISECCEALNEALN